MDEEITLEQAVKFAVVTEQLGRDWYRKLADRFGEDEEIREIFLRLARDEKAHELRFRDLLGRLPEQEELPDYAEHYGLLKAMSISEFFSSRDDLDRIADGLETRDDALEKALDFEKATLGYYRSLEDFLGEEPALREIIGEEKQHVTALMRTMMTESKFRGLDDDYP